MALAARLVRLLLVAALLSAQHAALAHGIGHAADNAIAQHSAPGGNPLCGQHAALETVLGAIGGVVAPAPAEAAPADDPRRSECACVCAAPPAPSSRGPPSLL